MNKKRKVVILLAVISVTFLTALYIKEKGRMTDLSGSVNPLSIKSSDVPYTSYNQSTVQGAIDNLYKRATAKQEKDNTVYFAFGEPTTSSTTDYTTLNKGVFVALNGGQRSVCIIKDNRLHCFDNNNNVIEEAHARRVFLNDTCGGTPFLCYEGTGVGKQCDFYPDGSVYCYDGSTKEYCTLSNDNSVTCTKR